MESEAEVAHERERKRIIESKESVEEVEVPICGFLVCKMSVGMVVQHLGWCWNL